MEGTCPHCASRLDLPASGTYRCERCGAPFQVALRHERAAPHGRPGTAWHSPPTATEPYPGAGLENRPYYGPDDFLRQPRDVLPATEPEGADPSLHAPCAAHPDARAVGVCERCGDFICRRCSTAVEGRTYCPPCFGLLNEQRAFAVTHPQSALPAMSLILGASAILGSGLAAVLGRIPLLFVGGVLSALIAGVLGVALGLRAFAERRDHPDQSGGVMAAWGLGLSGTGICLAIAAAGYTFFALVRGL